jgi:hypothetical protein
MRRPLPPGRERVKVLLLVRLISEVLEIVVCSLVGEKEEQAQEFAVDAARGRHACRQESHQSVLSIGVATITNLVGSGALEDLIRVVGVAQLAMVYPPIAPSAKEIVAQGDVHQQIRLPHAHVEDFEIRAAVALVSTILRGVK